MSAQLEKRHSMQFIFALLLVLSIWAHSEARQIRINRYVASVQDDDVQQAVVTEVKPTPYSAAGFRPKGRAFWLKGEVEAETEVTPTEGSDLDITTTELPLDDFTRSTTEAIPLRTKTQLDSEDVITTDASIDLRSSRYFIKTPYPPAGFRPIRAFSLPAELKQKQVLKHLNLPLEADASDAGKTIASEPSNANHPVCGVSTNPLKPTPEPGSMDEPDSESVVLTDGMDKTVEFDREPTITGIPVAILLRS